MTGVFGFSTSCGTDSLCGPAAAGDWLSSAQPAVNKQQREQRVNITRKPEPKDTVLDTVLIISLLVSIQNTEQIVVIVYFCPVSFPIGL
jgi:hypothetical protein